MPKATFRVVDRLDPTLAPVVVVNVPIGVALFASLTLQVGEGQRRLAEQAFTLPNHLTYPRHELIFGARLAAKPRRRGSRSRTWCSRGTSATTPANLCPTCAWG